MVIWDTLRREKTDSFSGKVSLHIIPSIVFASEYFVYMRQTNIDLKLNGIVISTSIENYKQEPDQVMYTLTIHIPCKNTYLAVIVPIHAVDHRQHQEYCGHFIYTYTM